MDSKGRIFDDLYSSKIALKEGHQMLFSRRLRSI